MNETEKNKKLKKKSQEISRIKYIDDLIILDSSRASWVYPTVA